VPHIDTRTSTSPHRELEERVDGGVGERGIVDRGVQLAQRDVRAQPVPERRDERRVRLRVVEYPARAAHLRPATSGDEHRQRSARRVETPRHLRARARELFRAGAHVEVVRVVPVRGTSAQPLRHGLWSAQAEVLEATRSHDLRDPAAAGGGEPAGPHGRVGVERVQLGEQLVRREVEHRVDYPLVD